MWLLEILCAGLRVGLDDSLPTQHILWFCDLMFDTESYIIFIFAFSVFLQQAVGHCQSHHPNHPTGLKSTKELDFMFLKL